MGSVYLRLKERDEAEGVEGRKMENDNDKNGRGQVKSVETISMIIFITYFIVYTLTFNCSACFVLLAPHKGTVSFDPGTGQGFPITLIEKSN